MGQHGQAGRETRRLVDPVGDDRERTDEQDRPGGAEVPHMLEEGQRLDGLAESHVVGEAGAEPPLA